MNKNGLTLTELLIASVLMGIVMAGAVAVEFAIRRNRENVAGGGRAAMALQAAMMQMSRDALMATGDASNAGIVSDSNGAFPENICFRQDDDNNPNDYDNFWACYSQDADSEIRRCTPSAPLAADASCAGKTGDELIIELTNAAAFFTITATQSVQFNLATRANPDNDMDYMTNPEYNLTSTVSPPALSR